MSCRSRPVRMFGAVTWAHGSAGERLLHTQEVGGSNPPAPTKSGTGNQGRGRIAQLVERLLYTQVVTGSSPVSPIAFAAGEKQRQEWRLSPALGDRPEGLRTTSGAVVQLVSTLACQARGRGFKSRRLRHCRAGRPVSEATMVGAHGDAPMWACGGVHGSPCVASAKQGRVSSGGRARD